MDSRIAPRAACRPPPSGRKSGPATSSVSRMSRRRLKIRRTKQCRSSSPPQQRSVTSGTSNRHRCRAGHRNEQVEPVVGGRPASGAVPPDQARGNAAAPPGAWFPTYRTNGRIDASGLRCRPHGPAARAKARGSNGRWSRKRGHSRYSDPARHARPLVVLLRSPISRSAFIDLAATDPRWRGAARRRRRTRTTVGGSSLSNTGTQWLAAMIWHAALPTGVRQHAVDLPLSENLDPVCVVARRGCTTAPGLRHAS